MPVQVLVEKSDSFGSFFNDVYQALELELSGLEYFTQAYIPDISCSGSYYKQFFSVVSFFNDTIVEVASADGVQYEKNLGDFGTYTEMTTFSGDHLARGTRVQSSKPVNVISGNLCVINSASGDAEADTYLSSIVPNTALMNEYIIPSITTGSGEHPGYSVSVVAIENDTDVEFNRTLVQELRAGEAVTFEIPYSNKWSLVNCSITCSVVQFAKSIRGTAGTFMTQIQPLQEFYTSAYFTTPDFHNTYLSIVVEGTEDPELILNGIPVDDVTWGTVAGYRTGTITVTHGTYHLSSPSDRFFTVYVYTHAEYYQGTLFLFVI